MKSILKKQCLKIDYHVTWKNHIAQMISNLSGACYAVRLMVHISNINTQIVRWRERTNKMQLISLLIVK